jgi:hypothetical protein
VLVAVLLGLRNPEAETADEDENDDDSMNGHKILVSIHITG